MSAWTAGTMIEARSLARRMGLTRLIQRLPGSSGYETRVRETLRTAIRAGDTVWDIGANVGLYTRLFSDWVGANGQVVAFEPVPACFGELQASLDECDNVQALNIGLSDVEAKLPMHLSDDLEGTRHTFATPRGSAGPVMELAVAPGDALRRVEELPVPNVLKIDVEGFELEALRGLDATLREPACRMALCEVHFGILEARGQKHAPREIQDYLNARGFFTKWVDASHLGAYRRGSNEP